MKKGPLAEAQVVACLREHGWPYAERRVQGGVNDRGDVAGIPGVVIEVKSVARIDLSTIVDEMTAEAGVGGDVGLSIIKRRGKGDPLDWYMVTTVRDGLALLAEYTRED